MMAGFRQRIREQMMISDLEEEDVQPKSPVESSYNLSAELRRRKTLQMSNATVVASQEQRTSFHDETVVSFNPPAYSTICEFSDSSPGCRVSETDSDNDSDSLYKTTIEPPDDTVVAVGETKLNSSVGDILSGMQSVISGIQSLQLKSRSPGSVTKPRRNRKSLVARALLSNSDSSDNESLPSIPVKSLSLKKRRSMAARALVLSDSDDDTTLPSSVSKQHREELSARLQHILSTCKKKKPKKFPTLFEASSDSISAVKNTPEILASESTSIDSVGAKDIPNLLENSDSITVVRQTPEILAPESSSIDTDYVSSNSQAQVVPESSSIDVNNVSLQVSFNSGASRSPGGNDSVSVCDVGLQVSLQSTPESAHKSADSSLHLVLSQSAVSEKNDSSVSDIQSALKKLNFSTSDESAESPVFKCQAPSAVSPPENQSPEKSANYISSDGDSDFENFIQSQKRPPRPSPKQSHKSLKGFIVDDLSSDEGASASDESVFYARTDRILEKKKPLETPSRQRFYECENGTLSNVPRYPSPRKKAASTPRPLALANITNSPAEEPQPMSFLASLTTNICNMRRHPDAHKYADLKNFRKVREELSARLFKLYNETVFDKQLPEDLEIKWNVRMTKTAGCCAYKKTPHNRFAVIELSCKVCDSAERLRDTMIHEMCHAAVWLIHGEQDGHGPLWQLYARRANRIHSEIPVISRCHSYSIQTKYTYKCSKCGYEVGRHSKSLDTLKKVCGYCRGTFEVFINTPRRTPGKRLTPAANRTPNPFAQFVKENYALIKQGDSSLTHKDIMRKLSEEFKNKK